jgi:hypothetical protein
VEGDGEGVPVGAGLCSHLNDETFKDKALYFRIELLDLTESISTGILPQYNLEHFRMRVQASLRALLFYHFGPGLKLRDQLLGFDDTINQCPSAIIPRLIHHGRLRVSTSSSEDDPPGFGIRNMEGRRSCSFWGPSHGRAYAIFVADLLARNASQNVVTDKSPSLRT